jgi:predicted esterase
MTSSSSPSESRGDATPSEHHIEVRRSARWFSLGSLGPFTRELWIVAHGYGQLASRFLRVFAHVASDECAVVAAEGLSRFYVARGSTRVEDKVGASWMTREDRLREIDDYVAYLDAVHDAALAVTSATRVRVTVLGFSQGASTVTRWVARGRARPARLVLCSGVLPPDLTAPDFERLRALEVYMVMGRNDDLARPALLEPEVERLRAGGVEVTLLAFDGGHEVSRSIVAELARR